MGLMLSKRLALPGPAMKFYYQNIKSRLSPGFDFTIIITSCAWRQTQIMLSVNEVARPADHMGMLKELFGDLTLKEDVKNNGKKKSDAD